jgi:hypothetical protein
MLHELGVDRGDPAGLLEVVMERIRRSEWAPPLDVNA